MVHKRDLNDKASIQTAVRQVADQYLDDPNINSVGLGYKMKNGRPTDTLALQFTVGRKFGPEALESVETEPIPRTVTANGITFDTDVVERDFERHPVTVAPKRKSERKRRVSPIVPGVSIGHIRSTAGTLGCLVKDDESEAVRILSNWHVLNGPTGELGDPIVQPGPHDDDRTAKNVCGKLERSFLGLAGDCATASISGRAALPEILDLGVAVRQIGDPELGDRVVKSGRTTNVTYGLVTRIHTITELDYDEEGRHRIGGFEIGPDEEHSAENGEISMGGDSGSAWLATAKDSAATDMMLGLHFAGETTEPAEYALACYASSVFEKLEISPLDPSGRAERTVAQPELGFDVDFLPEHRLPLPRTSRTTIKKDYAPTKAGDAVRHYTHFSLTMSASRRFCRWVAWNIDGSCIKQLPRKDLSFKLDDAYDVKYQVGDELYGKPANALDRGHIARRADLIWGTEDEARQANIDSFFFTNITPQLDDFNQSKLHGLWGELENAIFEDADVEELHVSVFGGPLFRDNDFLYRKVLVPRSYWKAIAYVERETLKAKAFLLTQDDLEAKLEAFGLEPFKLYQVSVTELSKATGLTFGPLTKADTMPPRPEALDAAPVRRIEARSQIVEV